MKWNKNIIFFSLKIKTPVGCQRGFLKRVVYERRIKTSTKVRGGGDAYRGESIRMKREIEKRPLSLTVKAELELSVASQKRKLLHFEIFILVTSFEINSSFTFFFASEKCIFFKMLGGKLNRHHEQNLR